MNSVAHIFHYKTVAAGSYIKNLNGERFLRMLVAVIVMSIFFAGSLFFFHRVFSYLDRLSDVGLLIMNKVISLGFLAIFVMLIISNFVTSISTLYRSPETTYLLSTPASHRQVFVIRFVDNLTFSTWAVLLLGLPLVIAYGIVRNFHFWHYIFEFFCVIVPFIIIPGCIGVGLSLLLFLFSRKVSPRTMIVTVSSFLVLAIAIYFKFGQPGSMAFNVISDWRVLNNYLGSVGATSFPFLPSYWVAESLRIISSSGGASLLVYMLALITTAYLFVNLLFAAAGRFYYKSWLASLESYGNEAKKTVQKRKVSEFFKLPSWLPTDFRAVLSKDLKLFTREPAQWAQFTVLLVLLIIYLVNLKYFPTEIKDSFWKTIIGFINFAFSGFILATLSVRFVFPNFSLEGKSFWIIASSPMPLRRVFWEKFWSAFLIFLLISEVLALVSNIMLGLRGALMMVTFGSVLLMSISLTSLSIGMGAAYPRFDERNPGKIASSMGGMLTTVLSLTYVGLMVIFAALPANRYSAHKLDPTIPFPKFEVALTLVLVLILSLTTTIVPLRLGLSSMKKRDF